MAKHFWQGIATITGVSIGAGILALPYAINKVGFLLGAIEIIIIGIAMLMLNLFLGEVILRTKGNHQLYNLAGKYLGYNGKRLMFIAFVLGIYGAIAAYLIGEGELISLLLNIPYASAGVIFFCFLAIITYFGVNILEKSEMTMNAIKILLFLSIFYFVANDSFSYANLARVSYSNILLPLGTLLFSFMCFSILPEIKEELKGNYKDLKKVIIIASIITIIVYILFTFLVIGATGDSTSEVATIALSIGFNSRVMVLINLFAVVTILTAAVALSFALKQMFIEDFKIKNVTAWLLTLLPPVVISVMLKSFSTIIALTGAITGGLTGAMVMMMYQNAKKYGDRKPEYFIRNNIIIEVLLLIIFVAALFIEILSII